MTEEYSPRVAIVTGASQGIGRAIALRLARDGIDVAVNDLCEKKTQLDDVVTEIQGLGRKSLAVVADVSVEEQVMKMVSDTVASLGCVDIMVANAGIVGAGTLDTLPVETFDKVIAVNLRGTMMCYKYAGQEMIKQDRGGRIIGASSVVGKKGSESLSAYSASKFAIRGLTQSFALEMLAHRVTVNAYCPGLIITEMTANPSDALLGGKHGAAVRKRLGVPSEIPDGQPEDIASWVSYICKPEAHYITGTGSLIAAGAVMD